MRLIFRRAVSTLLLAGVVLGVGAPLAAQPGRDDDRRNSNRGGYNPAEVLPRFDQNQDGVIQPDEVSGRYRRFYERMSEEAGFDPAGPVNVKQAVERIEKKKQQKQQQQAQEELRETLLGGFKVELPEQPEVPGFGADPALPVVPGFGPPTGDALPLEQLFTERLLREVDDIFKRYDDNGDGRLNTDEQKDVRWSSDPKKSDLNGDGEIDRREMAERLALRWGDSARVKQAEPSAAASTTSSNGKASSDRIRSYAASLLKQYDANKSGVLEKEEWSKMNGNPEQGDANKDGVLTLDELANRLANYSRSGSSDRDGDRSSDRPSRSSYYRSRVESRPSSDTKSQPDSYRFLSPVERLPKGTPDWFVKSDTNGDGQVAMHEYSATWNDSKAEEFEKFDLDGNGIITPDEARD